jgi:hypothetical protein
MRTLIYKRTHNGDPDEDGCFGVYDCMGQVKDWNFDAVIGVGGIGKEPIAERIAGQVNWIGIGPHKKSCKHGTKVTFDHFVFYGKKGPDFRKKAPCLAERMYSKNVRLVMDALSHQEQAEVK